MDRSALPWRGGQPGIGGNLLSVVERAEQALRPERGGRLGSNDGVDAPRRHRGAKVVVLYQISLIGTCRDEGSPVGSKRRNAGSACDEFWSPGRGINSHLKGGVRDGS